jgi:DNA-binding NarL/FixJ family response regulator
MSDDNRRSEATRRRIEEVGCAAYLPKPFSAKSLVEAIEQADRHIPTPVPETSL